MRKTEALGLYTLAAVCLLAVGSVNAQETIWARQFGSPGDDAALAVHADATGVYVAGYTEGALPGQAMAGKRDAFIRKYDGNGNELWARQFGSAARTEIHGICGHASGVYVVGEAYGALPGQAAIAERGGGYRPGGRTRRPDAFVRKYDRGGNELWTAQFGTQSGARALAVCADPTGVWVVGETFGTLPGQARIAKRPAGHLRAIGKQRPPDAFVRKYDADGKDLWTRQFGTQAGTSAVSVCSGPGGVYVAGHTWGSALPGFAAVGQDDAFVRKYDRDGNELWSKQFGSPKNDSADGIAAEPDGVYVAGSTSGVLPGQAPAGKQDAFVRKYDAKGNELWTRQFGTALKEQASGPSADASGVYVIGSTEGVFRGQTYSGKTDVFVARYDAKGNEVWIKELGTALDDEPTAICADSTGLYVVGSTSGVMPKQTAAGKSDAFVVELSPGGAP